MDQEDMILNLKRKLNVQTEKANNEEQDSAQLQVLEGMYLLPFKTF